MSKTILLLVACSICTMGQAQRKEKFAESISRSWYFPVKVMNQSMGFGAGLNASCALRISEKPWNIGFSYMFNRHDRLTNTIDYTYESVPVKANLELYNLTNMLTVFGRREFLFRKHPGFVPYVEAGFGLTSLRSHIDIYSTHEETTTQTVTTSDQDYCVPYSTSSGSSTQTVTTTQVVRDNYVVEDIIKDRTIHGYVGGGINIGIIPFTRYNRDQDNYPEGRGIYLNIAGGYYTGGSISYTDISSTDPHHDHASHTGTHVPTRAYSINFINLKTNAVHEHQVGNIYSSPLSAFSIQVGLILRI